MGDIQKRTALTKAYPGRKWADKVKRMPEDQVVATYLRLKRAGKL